MKLKLVFLLLFFLPIVQAAPAQIMSGQDPIALNDGSITCVFSSGAIQMSCIDPSTGNPALTKTVDSSTNLNIDGDFGGGFFFIVGEFGDDIKVNVADLSHTSNFFISAPGKQSMPKISYNPTHDQIGIVWQDDRLGTPSVYFQAFERSGNPVFPEQLVSAGSDPGIVYNFGNSEYMIAFVNISDNNLYYAILDPQGAVTTPVQIVEDVQGSQTDLDVSIEPAGGSIFFTYTDTRQGFGTDVFLTEALAGFVISGNPADDVVVSSDPSLNEKKPDVSCSLTVEKCNIVFEANGNIYSVPLLYDPNQAIHFVGQPLLLGSGSDPSVNYLPLMNAYYVAYQNGNNIMGLFLDSNGQELSEHSLVGILSGYDVYDLSGNKLSVGFKSLSNTQAAIKHNQTYVADVVIELGSIDVDLSPAVIESIDGKAYMDFSNIVGVSNPAIYMENTNSGSGFYVCPQAKSLQDVSESCSDKRLLDSFPTSQGTSITSSLIDASIEDINGVSYYRLQGLGQVGVFITLSGTSLAVLDTSDLQSVLPNQGMDFSASYTEKVTNQKITSGTCSVSFSVDPTSGSSDVAMSLDSRSKDYMAKNISFPNEGTFNYTVTCSGGSEPASATSTFVIGDQNIQGSTKPTITSIEPSDGSSVSNASLSCSAKSDTKTISKITLLLDQNEVASEQYVLKKDAMLQANPVLNQGSHLLECIAEDSGGDSSSRKSSFTVGSIQTTCLENWECGEWSKNVDALACGERSCDDKNNCGTQNSRPVTDLPCGVEEEFPWIFLLPVLAIIAGVVGMYFYSKRESNGEET